MNWRLGLRTIVTIGLLGLFRGVLAGIEGNILEKLAGVETQTIVTNNLNRVEGEIRINEYEMVYITGCTEQGLVAQVYKWNRQGDMYVGSGDPIFNHRFGRCR